MGKWKELTERMTMKCDRCGEVEPAEIHTCSPDYVDRRQWKYDPMTGKKLWQGLTADERIDCEKAAKGNYFDLLDEHEAKLKEKNHGSL